MPGTFAIKTTPKAHTDQANTSKSPMTLQLKVGSKHHSDQSVRPLLHPCCTFKFPPTYLLPSKPHSKLGSFTLTPPLHKPPPPLTNQTTQHCRLHQCSLSNLYLPLTISLLSLSNYFDPIFLHPPRLTPPFHSSNILDCPFRSCNASYSTFPSSTYLDLLTFPQKLSHRGEGCLVLGFVLSVSCFILKSNSPLISGHLPFLLCHLSGVFPDS